MEKSSIKIISNIALKSSYERNSNAYLPYDLLPKSYWDARVEDFLTPYQRKQQLKKMFHAEKIVDEE